MQLFSEYYVKNHFNITFVWFKNLLPIAMKTLLLLAFAFISFYCNAQFVQTIRGTVVDKESQYPLIGVNVVVQNSNPVLGTATNEKGEFQLKDLPVGKYTLQITYLGYQTAVIRDLEITSGKQKVIRVELEEFAITTDEIVVKAFRKGETINKMASVSARSFSVAETERYAGSMGDPARMASNFAGVSQAGDERNDIIIRGNSPAGLQWRLEGMDIPNPNHWSASGSTGGPVSMLNNNTLSNSDFFTSAFPAQYGNALSGVFDLKMRSGNNQKHEFTGQVGFNGFEFMAEGPFSKNYDGSFMISGRYSVLEVMDMIGVDVAGGAVPEYQDITFKVDLPTAKLGKFAIFGMGGRSNIDILSDNSESEQYSTLIDTDTYNGSLLALIGATNHYFLNEKTYFYTSASFSESSVNTTVNDVWNEMVDPPIDSSWVKREKPIYGEGNSEQTLTLTTRFVQKINSKNTLTIGVGASSFNIVYKDSFRVDDANPEYFRYLTNTDEKGLLKVNTYTEWQHKFNNKLTMNTGLHYQNFTYNNSFAFEPRLGFTYKLNSKSALNIGYGNHSKMQPLFFYVIETEDYSTRTYTQTNKDLEFTKAHHLVLGYDKMFSENLHFKVETYYQDLYNVPVSQRPTAYSMLNEGASFHINRVDSLVNKGTGYNYGIDVTFEKYLHNNFYFMFTGSVFESKYKGSDNIERNTAFNSNFSTNILGGYEYRFNDSYSIDFNIRTVYAGGRRTRTIDLDASIIEEEVVYDDSKLYAEREKDYFKIDFRVSFKQNKKRYSQEWALDIGNITNHKNVFSRAYNDNEKKLEYIYQQGFFPMFLYRINF